MTPGRCPARRARIEGEARRIEDEAAEEADMHLARHAREEGAPEEHDRRKGVAEVGDP
jgi:hypothetical protein